MPALLNGNRGDATSVFALLMLCPLQDPVPSRRSSASDSSLDHQAGLQADEDHMHHMLHQIKVGGFTLFTQVRGRFKLCV